MSQKWRFDPKWRIKIRFFGVTLRASNIFSIFFLHSLGLSETQVKRKKSFIVDFLEIFKNRTKNTTIFIYAAILNNFRFFLQDFLEFKGQTKRRRNFGKFLNFENFKAKTRIQFRA
jgi:hypothetical protein